jgi:phosphate/sulfate permease
MYSNYNMEASPLNKLFFSLIIVGMMVYIQITTQHVFSQIVRTLFIIFIIIGFIIIIIFSFTNQTYINVGKNYKDLLLLNYKDLPKDLDKKTNMKIYYRFHTFMIYFIQIFGVFMILFPFFVKKDDKKDSKIVD